MTVCGPISLMGTPPRAKGCDASLRQGSCQIGSQLLPRSEYGGSGAGNTSRSDKSHCHGSSNQRIMGDCHDTDRCINLRTANSIRCRAGSATSCATYGAVRVTLPKMPAYCICGRRGTHHPQIDLLDAQGGVAWVVQTVQRRLSARHGRPEMFISECHGTKGGDDAGGL